MNNWHDVNEFIERMTRLNNRGTEQWTMVNWTSLTEHILIEQRMVNWPLFNWPLNLWLGSIVVSIKAWKSSRVRGNYYILQNSWFGSIVAWIIVVWIKGWKSSRDDRFAEHYSPLWFGSSQAIVQLFVQLIVQSNIDKMVFV